MNVTVVPTLKGFGITIEGGSPPYEIYAWGSILVYKGSNPFFHYDYDLPYNIDDFFILVRDSQGQEVKASPGNPTLDRYELGFIREILRRESLVLRKKGGFEAKVFIRRKPEISEPCPHCRGGLDNLVKLINDIRSELTSCEYCFGTGLAGGYYPPITTYINYFGIQTQRVDSLEPIRVDPVVVYTLNYPLIEREDLIWSETLGRMLRISQSQTITYKGIPIKQILQTFILPEGHPAYRLAREIPVVIVDKGVGLRDNLSR